MNNLLNVVDSGRANIPLHDGIYDFLCNQTKLKRTLKHHVMFSTRAVLIRHYSLAPGTIVQPFLWWVDTAVIGIQSFAPNERGSKQPGYSLGVAKRSI